MKHATWSLLVIPLAALLLLPFGLPWWRDILAVALAVAVISTTVLALAHIVRNRLARTGVEAPDAAEASPGPSTTRTAILVSLFAAVKFVLELLPPQYSPGTLADLATSLLAALVLGAFLGSWARQRAIAVTGSVISIGALVVLSHLLLFSASRDSGASPESGMFALAGAVVVCLRVFLEATVALGAWSFGEAIARRSGSHPTATRTRTLLIATAAACTLVTPPLVDVIQRERPTDQTGWKVPGVGVAVTATRISRVPVEGESSVFARSGADLLVVTGGEARPLQVLRGDRLDPIEVSWAPTPSVEDLRCTLDDQPFLVLPGNFWSPFNPTPGLAVSVRETSQGSQAAQPLRLPTPMEAPLVVDSGRHVLAAGYARRGGGSWTALVRGLRDEGLLDLQVWSLALEKPQLLTTIPALDDSSPDLAASGDDHGLLHLVVTWPRPSDGDVSIVRYREFDPVRRAWQNEQLLWARRTWTSRLKPRLFRTNGVLVAAWLAESGNDLPASDGLYVRALGDGVTWHLANVHGEYSVLPDADGRGGVLVGVATNPSMDGRVRWFLLRGSTWTANGGTDFGERLYTLGMSGTEPFALWRDAQGTVRAAFRTEGHILLADLSLPE